MSLSVAEQAEHCDRRIRYECQLKPETSFSDSPPIRADNYRRFRSVRLGARGALSLDAPFGTQSCALGPGKA